MKKRVCHFALSAVIVPFCLLSTIYPVHGQINAVELPINEMVTVNAPDAPLDRKTAPKKLLRHCSYESQKVSDYVKVQRFTVVPGQKYTLYDCHPALADGSKIWVYLDGDTPLTNHTASYGPSGFTRTFVTRAQQPWPITKNEQAKCALVRYNLTIAPRSEHNNLYVTFVFNKPGASTKIMLKHPADSDDDVRKSTSRSWGDVKSAPFLLTNIPGETTSSVNPPAKPEQPNSSTVTLTKPAKQKTPSTPQTIVLKEAPATSANAAIVSYNSRIQAYINRGDYDTFRFDFPGGRMRISSEGGLDIVADLWNDKGNRIARDGQDAKKDFLIEKDLPAGTYYIQIRYMNHAGEGPYNLILGDGSGQLYKEAGR